MTQSVESRNIGGQVVYGVSAEDLAKAIAILVSSGALHTYGVERREGEDANAWRNWGGPMVEMVEITGSTDGQAITGECWIYGMQTTVAGTSTTLDLHQGTSTSGINLAPGLATGTINVVGYKHTFGPGGGVGIHCPDGVFANWGGSGSPKVALFVVRAQP